MNPRPALAEFTPPISLVNSSRLPLRGWSLELARRWNSGSYSLFILHGNIFDVFPIQEGPETAFVSLKTFLVRRIFPERTFLLFYDIGDGLTFGSADMQRRFFEWLEVFDRVENTQYHIQGPPREFNKLAPLLRRFCLYAAEEQRAGITLIVDFPEKIVPASSGAYASSEERTALVTLMKWSSSPELRRCDVGVMLITESANELNEDLLRNPHIAQIKIELPDFDDRLLFLGSGNMKSLTEGKPATEWSSLTLEDLAQRLSGLNLLRTQHVLAEAIRNQTTVTGDYVAASKKKLIEEYCQGLVRFKNPKPGLNLEAVATHGAAKKRLRELAWLIQQGKREVLERGVLLPGRVGVGKSFLVDCFASECSLPVMELGEFRSKWVGDTELQQARILMTIRALGPVIVVVDEADAVFGSRESGSDDSGVSSRVFAAFAAHIGDTSLRGRELWIAMTSRPDLLAIDMKRQGRFGLSIPLFPAQNDSEVLELFAAIAKARKISLSDSIQQVIRQKAGERALTGSDAEAILVRAQERAVLAQRDADVQADDIQAALDSFIDALDPNLLALQELAAVLACSDRRYLPERYQQADRAQLVQDFSRLKTRLGIR
jgi:AAA+ superfamily predicted ATPase